MVVLHFKLYKHLVEKGDSETADFLVLKKHYLPKKEIDTGNVQTISLFVRIT